MAALPATRGRLPTGGNRNMKINRERKRGGDRERGEEVCGGADSTSGKVCGNCQRAFCRAKKKIIFICLTHMRLRERKRGRGRGGEQVREAESDK